MRDGPFFLGVNFFYVMGSENLRPRPWASPKLNSSSENLDHRQRCMVRSIFLGHFIPSVLQPTIVKFLFNFNCMSVSLYKLSTVSDPPL